MWGLAKKPFCSIVVHMPITRSAKRAVRVSTRKKAVNDRNKKAVKESIKTVEKTVATKGDTKKILSSAFSAIDKAAKRGVISKNTAARRKSRLSRITKAK